MAGQCHDGLHLVSFRRDKLLLSHGQALETEEDLCRGPEQSTSLQHPDLAGGENLQNYKPSSTEPQQGHPGAGASRLEGLGLSSGFVKAWGTFFFF